MFLRSLRSKLGLYSYWEDLPDTYAHYVREAEKRSWQGWTVHQAALYGTAYTFFHLGRYALGGPINDYIAWEVLPFQHLPEDRTILLHGFFEYLQWLDGIETLRLGLVSTYVDEGLRRLLDRPDRDQWLRHPNSLYRVGWTRLLIGSELTPHERNTRDRLHEAVGE